MRYTEIRKEINSNLDQGNSLSRYLKDYLSTSVQDKIIALQDKYVEHLYSDLIDKSVSKNLKNYLGSYYSNANEYANTCVHTVFKSKDIYSFKLNGWTDAALKCFDNLLLVLIQEHLNETIKKRVDKGFERQKYWHLIEKGGVFYEIGIRFDIIYQKRNQFMHIEVVNDTNGKRKQKRLSQSTINNMKDDILTCFKEALIALENMIE
jgi:hypothetical protein